MGFKISGKFIKRCVIYLTLLVVIVLGAASSYVYVVVSELERKLELQELSVSNIEFKKSNFEKESYVQQDDFNFFLNFIDSNEITENRDEYVSYTKGRYLILKDFELSAPSLNNCDVYGCLQSRIKFEGIPSNLWKGLMGVEDFRFLEHKGVDPISILRAIIVDIQAMSFVQGGSTLTQQLAKNLFLSNEKKFQRKIQEMIYAIYLEQNYEKDEIITKYFNEVFWGVVGGVKIKGIKMASLSYFQKDPSNLTPFESAILISMLKGPVYYNPKRHLERLKERVRAVFNRLTGLRLFRKDSQRWSDDQWFKWQDKIKSFDENKRILSLYRTLSNDEMGMEPYEKFSFNRAVVYTFKELKERTEGLDIAVKSMAIDLNCEDINCKNVFSYYSKFERDKRIAMTEENHQVGSILKPLIYKEFINLGKSLEDKISTKKITLDLISGKWTPSDHDYGGVEEVTLKYAIQKSRNRPLIRTAQEVGFDNLEKALQAYFPEKLLTPLSEYPAQLLGAIELSLNDVSKAYLSFFKNECRTIAQGEYAFEDSLIYVLAQAGQTTIRNAANDVLQNSLIFGKTGTTNNGLDNWYIASDGEKFYITWFGVDSAREAKELRLYGSNSSFRIFQYFITYRGKQIRDFYCL